MLTSVDINCFFCPSNCFMFSFVLQIFCIYCLSHYKMFLPVVDLVFVSCSGFKVTFNVLCSLRL